jgi:hypothetical protein
MRPFGRGTITPESEDRRLSLQRVRRLFVIALGLALGYAALQTIPIWTFTLFEEHVPSWLVRKASIAFLQASLVLYGLAIVFALGGLCWVGARLTSMGWRGVGRRSAQLCCLCTSILFGLALMEAGACLWQRHAHRLIDLPTKFAEQPPSTGKIRPVSIVVVGESTARGEPYHPWLSIAQIAAWQLERVFPGRPFELDVLADGGLCLEQAILQLNRGLKRRPDAIFVYSGHNEFATRYGWSRNVRHYAEEGPTRLRSAIREALARSSPLCGLISETIDTHLIDKPPPPGVSRELIDHPSFTPEEYAYLRFDYDRRLDGLVAYCERIGAVPILSVPVANDAGYAPHRSYLDPGATKLERDAFALRFLRARSIQNSAAKESEAIYRDLLRGQPSFAEAHFRLAELLERAGRWDEAVKEYALARDLDGLPMRSPSDFQSICRDTASRHPSVILLDGPKVLGAVAPHGILNDHLFHDAHHPNLRSYAILAQGLLHAMKMKRAFGWPENVPVPALDPAECARHFQIDREKWVEVCKRTTFFYNRTASIRYDPTDGLKKGHLYFEAARKIEAGAAPEAVGIPGVGVAQTRPWRIAGQ